MKEWLQCKSEPVNLLSTQAKLISMQIIRLIKFTCKWRYCKCVLMMLQSTTVDLFFNKTDKKYKIVEKNIGTQ